MTVIRDIPLSLGMNYVLFRVRTGSASRLVSESRSMILELLARIEERQLLEPAMCYELVPLNHSPRAEARLNSGVMLPGKMMTGILPGTKMLAAAVCTIGPRLEEEVTCCLKREERLQALLLDCIGSSAVDVLIQRACHVMGDEAACRGYRASSPLSPGMHHLDISVQPDVFWLAQGQRIGMRLTESGMLVPRKSVSLLWGLGARMPTWSKAEVCRSCAKGDTCIYREDQRAAQGGAGGDDKPKELPH